MDGDLERNIRNRVLKDNSNVTWNDGLASEVVGEVAWDYMINLDGTTKVVTRAVQDAVGEPLVSLVGVTEWLYMSSRRDSFRVERQKELEVSARRDSE